MPEQVTYRRLFLILAAVWLVLNASVLLGGKVLPWDALDQFYPTVYFNAHSLRHGEAPWWNPYIYAGYAQVGDPQGMLFSPLLMAWMMLLPTPGAWWFSCGVLLHLLMGGAAMLGVMRRHGANAFGALVGATVYMAGGVAASRLEHTPIVIAYAYVPVVLLALRYVMARPSVARGALLGLAAGAMVTQLVQVTYLFTLVVAGYGLFAVARCWPSLERAMRWRLIAALATAGVIAVAIGLPQLAFSWASLQLSNRQHVPLSAAEVGSLDVRAFLFLLDPGAFGALRDIHASPIDPIEAFLYIGVIPMLALVGLARAWRAGAWRRAIVAFSVLAVAACVYMLGTHTPVYGWLYGWMPGLSHFRRPSDGAYVFNVALAFLAAIGASQLNLGSRREVLQLVVVALAWFIVIAAVSRVGSALLAVLVAAFALWRLRKAGSAWRATVWLVVLLAADYRSFNFNGTFNDSGNGAARYAKQPAVRFLEAHLGHDAAPSDRVRAVGMNTLWENMGVLTGIPSTQGYNPLRYALHEQWYHARESANAPVLPAPYNALPSAPLDDLLGVRYIVVGHAGEGLGYVPAPDYVRERALPDADLWRNDGAYPRILNPQHIHALGVDALPDIDAFLTTNFASDLWLTPRDTDDLALGRTATARGAGSVRAEIVSSAASRLELATHSAEGGWLAMGDVDHPGWVARLDGEPLPIHRANGMFRAVRVPAGDHALSFTFSPWRMLGYAWSHRAEQKGRLAAP